MHLMNQCIYQTQPTFTCSKLTTGTLEGMKSAQLIEIAKRRQMMTHWVTFVTKCHTIQLKVFLKLNFE